MRVLSNQEIDDVAGAGLKADGKCYQFDAAGAVAFFVGWVKGTIESVWGSPDPWK